MSSNARHIPVMLNEVIQFLAPADGQTYVDATFGNGGYTTAILEKANCKVIAIDRDPSVEARAKEIKNIYPNRFTFISGRFSELQTLVREPVDGIVFDIGVSSMQLDDVERGFSFMREAKLDMRMSMEGLSAYDIVNSTPEAELADLIYQYGEEKKSRIIARKIAQKRSIKPIETTTELANIIYEVLHKKPGQTDPATRTFQAIRIAVNDELKELQKALSAATVLLKDKGRLVVVDFHSLEDRIVKNFFAENSGKSKGTSRYMPLPQSTDKKIFEYTSKAVIPTLEECTANPRARSAKLRYGIKQGDLSHD